MTGEIIKTAMITAAILLMLHSIRMERKSADTWSEIHTIVKRELTSSHPRADYTTVSGTVTDAIESPKPTQST